MAGQPFKKVSTGQTLDIPALMWNVLTDVANRERGRSVLGDEGDELPTELPFVRIKNSSGSAIDRGNVLGISGSLFTIANNPDEFKSRVVLTGATPTTASHFGKFAVPIEPIADGDVGRAVVLGCVPVLINFTDANHDRADVKNSDATQLQSSVYGSAQILWAEGGTGSKWALVRMGSKPACIPAKVTASSSISAVEFNYTCQTYDGLLTLSQVRNGFEPCDGSPGRLGVGVGSGGTLTGGTCVVKAIGNNAEVLLFPDPKNPGRWMFSEPNSAQ